MRVSQPPVLLENVLGDGSGVRLGDDVEEIAKIGEEASAYIEISKCAGAGAELLVCVKRDND